MPYTSIVIIPARLKSKRLNKKLLLPGPGGKPLLYFTWKRAMSSQAQTVAIATDSSEIAQEAKTWDYHGANPIVVTTDPSHNCGTNRIEEAYEQLTTTGPLEPVDCIINLQGDEPEIRGKDINTLIYKFQEWGKRLKELASHGHVWRIATLAVPFYDFKQYSLPQNVKVVFNQDCHALYFSRGMIPWIDNIHRHLGAWRLRKGEPTAYKHIGIYAYTPEMLRRFVRSNTSRLEEIEGLEQMRALENQWPILVTPITPPEDDRGNIWPLGVNTNRDYRTWRKRTG